MRPVQVCTTAYLSLTTTKKEEMTNEDAHLPMTDTGRGREEGYLWRTNGEEVKKASSDRYVGTRGARGDQHVCNLMKVFA
jgi:hypothetical protein